MSDKDVQEYWDELELIGVGLEGLRVPVTIDMEEYTVSYQDTLSLKYKVFDQVLDYFIRCEQFSAEGIHQSDTAQIEALDLVSNLADKVFKFNQEDR